MLFIAVSGRLLRSMGQKYLQRQRLGLVGFPAASADPSAAVLGEQVVRSEGKAEAQSL